MAGDVEIGDHTYSHVHCRSLSHAELDREIDDNRVCLEGLSRQRVRAFSVPYGSSKDLTGALLQHLDRSGYEAIFLSENAATSRGTNPLRFDRVTTRGEGQYGVFRDLEVLPRLRSIRNTLLGRVAS
jgi:peptidoglycan/xylan/chitin deacetylase (PgdA/CDA1 family)